MMIALRPVSRRRRAGQSGSVIVEAGLSLMVILLMTLGIIQIGYLVWAQNSIAFAVRAGVRYASLNGARSTAPASASQVQAVVRGSAPGLIPSSLIVTTTWAPNNRPGSVVTVSASYPALAIIPIIQAETITVRSATSMIMIN